MSRKIKIAYVITGLGFGGAETVLRDLIGSLDSGGFEIIVISLLPIGSVGEQIRDSGIRTFSLGMKSKLNPAPFFRLVKILNDEHPDIIHAHLFHADMMVRLASMIVPKSQIVSTIHNVNMGGSIRETLLRITKKLSGRFIAVGNQVLSSGIATDILDAGRSVVIHNGITIKDQLDKKVSRAGLGIPQDEYMVVSVGSLTKKKGYDHLIGATEMLQGESKASFYVLGEGAEREHLENLIRAKKNLRTSVRLVGATSRVAEYLASADLFVIPSLWEGFSIALLEAGMAGLPIVATDVGGNSELVDSETGILVPAGEAESLCVAIERAIRLSSEDRVRLGVAAREKVIREFSMEKMRDAHERLYEKLASEHKE